MVSYENVNWWSGVACNNRGNSTVVFMCNPIQFAEIVRVFVYLVLVVLCLVLVVVIRISRTYRFLF
jgi:hypothetical protein